MSDNNLIEKLEQYRFNPVSAIDAVMDSLERATDGKIDIVDPTNPFLQLIDVGTAQFVSLARADEVNHRKQYKARATTYEDLYHHMADVDYVGRFATPAVTNFMFYFSKQEIINRAVPVEGTTSKKLVIPRNTVITVSDLEFTLQYPIEIWHMGHGGFRVVYDTTQQSPLQGLETNTIDWDIGTINGNEIMILNVPIWQFKRRVFVDNLNPATGFKASYDLTDQYYHCYVHLVNGDKRIKLRTTHSEEIYDPKEPTALLRLYENRLDVEIPLVYFNTNQVTTKVEVTIMVTKGPMSLDLGELSADAFSLRLGEHARNDVNSKYSAPLETFSNMGVSSSSIITGGTNGLTFEETREIVINNGNKINLPITDAQIKAKLKIRGYDAILAVDNVLQRIYLATRHLPEPTVGEISAGAASAIDTVSTSMEDLAELETCYDNDDRITLSPKTLYVYKEGVPEVVKDGLRPENIANSPDHLVTLLNAEDYAYTPFHYVLDNSEEDFQLRAYYLDNPEIISRRFIAENDTTQLSAVTDSFTVERAEYGYRLVVSSKIGENYKNIPVGKHFVQLRFKPTREVDEAYINGTFIGEQDGLYLWEFRIETDYDVDRNHELIVNNFSIYSAAPRSQPLNLLAEFEVIYLTSDYDVFGMELSAIDEALGKHLLPNNVVGIAQESLKVRLGWSMEGLWSNGRTVAGSLKYLRRTEDKPRVYEETKYERNPDGSIKLYMNDGVPDYVIEHRKGDPVLIDGEVDYEWRKGDIVYDDDNNPVLESPNRETLRMLDLFLIDGVYQYATGSIEKAYALEVPKTVVGYLENDIRAMQDTLLEKTRLYYYPKRTLGATKVRINNNNVYSMPAVGSFEVKYFLDGNAYRNSELRAAIADTTSEVINDVLRQSTVSVEYMTNELRQALGDDVISIEVRKFGPGFDINTFTSTDESQRTSVKRLLALEPNGEKIVKEDITIKWVQHKA